MAESKYGKYIVETLQAPSSFTAEYNAAYAQWAKRVLWIDSNVVSGAPQMNCSWYCKPNDKHLAEPHVHDCDEIIAFFSGDPEDPYELGAEVEFWLEDEMFLLTRSCLIFVPKGMKHCPLILRKVDRPIFHFSTVSDGTYVLKKAEAQAADSGR